MRGRTPKEPKAAHCVADGCTAAVVALNLCRKHYSRQRRVRLRPPACTSGGHHVWTVLGTCKHCSSTRRV
jgi:hypothetical protein